MLENIADFISNRITSLREAKGVSARDMSLSLGQNHSYINRIENKQALPSYELLNEICLYFGINISQFFDEGIIYPPDVQLLIDEIKGLNRDSLKHLIGIVQQLNMKN